MELGGAPASVASTMALAAVEVVGIGFFAVCIASKVVVDVAPFTVVESSVTFISFPLSLVELIATRISFVHQFCAYLNFRPIVNFELSNPPMKSASNHKSVVIVFVIVNCVDY